MSLSSKFASLKKPAIKAKTTVGGVRTKVQQSVASQKSKRGAQTQARRTGVSVQAVKAKQQAASAAAKKTANGKKKPTINAVKKNIKGGAKATAGGRKKKAATAKKAPAKPQPKTQEELDMEMDQCKATSDFLQCFFLSIVS